jgi:hypothetical protein
LFYLALLIQLLLVLVEQVVLAQQVRDKLQPEFLGLTLFLVLLLLLAVAAADLLLAQLYQVGREVGLAALPLQGLLEQLARVTKAETLQMEVVVEVVLVLLAVMEPHRFQRGELLERVVQVLHLLLLGPALHEVAVAVDLEIIEEHQLPLVAPVVARLALL